MSEIETFDFPAVDVKNFLLRIEEEFTDDIKQNRIPYPVLGIGKAGIGKTEGVRGLCEKMRWGFKELRLVNYTETDLIGIPFKNEQGMTDHATNVIFPLEERDGKYGILLVDEFTSAPSNIQVPILQLTDSSRSVGNYHLPNGWKIVLAGNGPNDGGTFRSLPGTVISRASCYRVEPDVSSWLEWATTSSIHYTIRSYVRQNPSSLHGYSEDVDTGYDRAFPCPRTWTKLSRFLKDLDVRHPNWVSGEGLEPDYLRILIASNIGIPETDKFLSFLTFEKECENVDKILAANTSAERSKLKRIETMRREAAFMTITMLSDRIRTELAKPGAVDIMNLKFSRQSVQLYANACNWIFEGVRNPSGELATFAITDLNTTNKGTALTILGLQEFKDLCPSYAQLQKETQKIFKA